MLFHTAGIYLAVDVTLIPLLAVITFVTSQTLNIPTPRTPTPRTEAALKINETGFSRRSDSVLTSARLPPTAKRARAPFLWTPPAV